MKKKVLVVYLILFLLSCGILWATTKVSDTFTDTDNTLLNDHTPDTGTGWDGSANLEIENNYVLPDSDGGCASYYSQEQTSVGDDEMIVTGDITLGANFCCRVIGIDGRLPNETADGNDRWTFQYSRFGSFVAQIVECVSGSCNSRASTTTGIVDGSTYTLTITDTDVTVDQGATTDFLTYSHSDVLSGNQHAGLHICSRRSLHIDNFLVETVGGAPAGAPPQIIKNIVDYFTPKKATAQLQPTIRKSEDCSSKLGAKSKEACISSKDSKLWVCENETCNSRSDWVEYVEKVYQSPVCDVDYDDGEGNIHTLREPCVASDYEIYDYVELYDGGSYRIIKAFASQDKHNLVDSRYLKTRESIPSEAKTHIQSNGEGKFLSR